MRNDQPAPKNMEEYIAGFAQDVQEILEKIRMTIRKAAPDAEETIKYQIPTFTITVNSSIQEKNSQWRTGENI